MALWVVLAAAGATVSCDSQARMETPNVTPVAPALLDGASPSSLARAFTDAGLRAGTPRDVTAQRCPAIHCSAELDTDDVAILKFPSTGSAEKYADNSAASTFQEADVVLVFRADLPTATRTRYTNLLTRAVE